MSLSSSSSESSCGFIVFHLLNLSTNSINEDVFFADFMNEVFKSSLADKRYVFFIKHQVIYLFIHTCYNCEKVNDLFLTFCGSLLRQCSTNSLKFLLKFPVNFGLSFLGMLKRTFIGCWSQCGGSPFANSIAVMPRLQISAFIKICPIEN